MVYDNFILQCFVGEGPSLDQINFEMLHISK